MLFVEFKIAFGISPELLSLLNQTGIFNGSNHPLLQVNQVQVCYLNIVRVGSATEIKAGATAFVEIGYIGPS